MFRLKRLRIDEFRFLCESLEPFSYEPVGATKDGADAARALVDRSFIVDHHRTRIGEGAADWERAVAAVRDWKMFDIPWLELLPPGGPIEEGAAVAVLVRTFGLWSSSISRIAYVIDEIEPECRKFGFAYGTTSHHLESGEERFSVEHDETDGSVWFDLLAFSRPRHWLVKLGRPFARVMQKRFQVDSAKAMQRAVRGG